jgi:tetratricopeptide (TPR) repeat protein
MGLVAVFVHSAVDFNMQIPANAILVFCLAALLSSQLRYASERYWVQPGWLGRLVASGLMLGFVAFGGAQGVQLAREYRWLIMAEGESWHSLAEIAAYERAFAVEPKNFETAYILGEAFQTHSKQGGEDNAVLATNAITWFERGMELNRYDQRNYSGSGWCWDWLALRQDELEGLHEVAERCFLQAEALDPKGYYTVTDVGYHFVQAGNFAAARVWFERSLRLQRRENNTAEFYYKFTGDQPVPAATALTGVFCPGRAFRS